MAVTHRRSALKHAALLLSDRYGLVMLLILITYVLGSTLEPGAATIVAISAMQGLTLIAALAASNTRASRRRLGTVMAVCGTIAAIVTGILGGTGLGLTLFIGAALMVAALVAIIGRIARHKRVSAQTLLGAICCYLLFGLIFALTFAGVAQFHDAAFFTTSGSETFSNFLFFSFTTLTTTGYGNLIPATGLGRTLAVIESLTGQLFLVTVLARLVALWTPPSIRARSGADPTLASLSEQLERLRALRDDGSITDDDFEAAKTTLLARPG